MNLQTTPAGVNSSKGDGDAATWLPPNAGFRCRYVTRQIAVKNIYGLSVTAAEKAAMARVLRRCPAEALPTAREATTVVDDNPVLDTATASAPTTDTDVDPRFPNCRAARAAGYGPYRRGQDTEYAWYHDVDHDGIVCER